MDIDFENLQKSHNDLISRYYSAINEVSYMPVITFNSWDPLKLDTSIFKRIYSPKNWITHLVELISFPTSMVIRILVKFFVEWHIKNKLGILVATYAQLEQTIDTSQPNSEKQIKWLNSTQEGLKKFSDTLSIFSSIGTFLRSLSIIFSGLIITFIQILTKTLDLNNLLQVFLITGTFLFYSGVVISPSYKYKRQDVFSKKVKKSIDSKEKSSNIYQIENDLFQILGRNIPMEISIDYMLISFSLSLMCIFFIYSTITTPSGNFGNYTQIYGVIFTGIGAMMFFGFSYINKTK